MTVSPFPGDTVVNGNVVISAIGSSTRSNRWGGTASVCTFVTKWLVVEEVLTVVVAGTGTGSGGGIVAFEGGAIWDGRADGLMVLHIGGWDVINHGGLGRLVVVVVVAEAKKALVMVLHEWK